MLYLLLQNGRSVGVCFSWIYVIGLSESSFQCFVRRMFLHRSPPPSGSPRLAVPSLVMTDAYEAGGYCSPIYSVKTGSCGTIFLAHAKSTVNLSGLLGL